MLPEKPATLEEPEPVLTVEEEEPEPVTVEPEPEPEPEPTEPEPVTPAENIPAWAKQIQDDIALTKQELTEWRKQAAQKSKNPRSRSTSKTEPKPEPVKSQRDLLRERRKRRIF